MSTITKLLIALLVLILLVGGWYFMNKNGQSSMPSAPETSQEQDVSHEGHSHDKDHNHGQTEATEKVSTGEAGTVKVLPIDPLLGVRGVGDPNAPIKVQEFFSLTCNHCAQFHTGAYQELKAKYIDTGVIYFVYEEFPLNGPALYGSMISRCMPEERYAGFVDILFRTQDKWAFGGDFKNSLLQNAKLAGMSEEEFEACFNNQDLQTAMAKNISAATDAWNISSTPSFVVNNGERIIRGAKSMAVFDALVEELTGNNVSATE